MRVIAPLLFVLMVAGCGATVRGDKSAAIIDCSGWLQSLGDCVAAADDLCFDNYGYIARWDEGGRVMRVRCGGA